MWFVLGPRVARARPSGSGRVLLVRTSPVRFPVVTASARGKEHSKPRNFGHKKHKKSLRLRPRLHRAYRRHAPTAAARSSLAPLCGQQKPSLRSRRRSASPPHPAPAIRRRRTSKISPLGEIHKRSPTPTTTTPAVVATAAAANSPSLPSGSFRSARPSR
jgi:hypothetical protein